MKRASIMLAAASFLFWVNVDPCVGIAKVPAGYQKYKPYDPVPIDPDKVYGPAQGKKIKLFILSGQSNMVPLVDVEKHPNDVHFNTAGQLKTGRLFAEGYLELVKETNQK